MRATAAPQLQRDKARDRAYIGLAWVLLVLVLGVASLTSLGHGPNWGMTLASHDGNVVVATAELDGIAQADGIFAGARVLLIDDADPARYLAHPLPPGATIVWEDQGDRRRVTRAPALSIASFLGFFAVGLIFSALGAVVYRWSPDRRVRTSFLAFGQAVAVTLLTAPAGDFGYTWAYQISGATSVVVGSAFTLFAMAFPSPLSGFRLVCKAQVVITTVLLGSMAAFFVSGVDFPPAMTAGLWLWLIFQLAVSVVVLAARAICPATRKHLIPIVIGGAIGVSPVIVLTAIPYLISGRYLLRPEFAATGALTVPIGIAYAILRHHLFGLDAMLRRFLIRLAEVMSSAALIGLASFGVSALGGGVFAIIVAALLLGLAIPTFVPRVKLGVDAILYPRVARARLALKDSRPGGPLEHGERLVRAAREVVPVAWAILAVRGARTIETFEVGERSHGRVIASDGEAPTLPTGSIAWIGSGVEIRGIPHAQRTVVPIANDSRTFAALVVGPRLDGSPIGGIDLEALRLLAGRAAAPIEAALLRQQAEDEERYRQGLAAFARALAGAASPREILEIAVRRARTILDAEAGAVWEPDMAGGLTLVASFGDSRLLAGAPLASLAGAAAANSPFPPAGTGNLAMGADGSTMVFRLVGSANFEAVGLLIRAEASGRFGSRDVSRMAEMVEYATGALGRAEAVRAAAEAETLREINRVRTEIFDMVSHDLQSPLTVVRGYAELLQIRAGGDGDGFSGEAAEAILNAYRSCQRLIDDLLTTARLEKGRLSLTFDELDVAEVLDQLIGGIQVLPGGNRVAVEVTAGLVVRADRTRLEQMVGNLVSNALRYAPRGPIVVRGSGSATEVTIEVRDYGPGISPEELPKIWEKFYRVGSGRVAPRGSGVGLSVVRDLAERHGGRAEVESVVGQGTTFRLVFPSAHPRGRETDHGLSRAGDAPRPGPERAREVAVA